MVALCALSCQSEETPPSSGEPEVELPPLPPAGSDLPTDEAESVRFLTRATFGPGALDRAVVDAIGYSAWIDWQVRLPATQVLPGLMALGCAPELAGCEPDPEYDSRAHFEELHWTFWSAAVYGEDQLRQRVAFALSEIFVVSARGNGLTGRPALLADFYDVLLRQAFGNYRELLEEVTLHPAMGIYLSMAGNRKADPVLGTHPDENFAREVMQLFSIGLYELSEGGEPSAGSGGALVPTYDQDVINGMARAFTGWTFASDEAPTDVPRDFLWAAPRLGRMEPWPAFHETGSKLLVGNVLDPGGLTAEADLAQALDLLANHPNVGPFLGRQLIQRLVTSNPSPAYVARVAAAWNDDGSGERGNLGAVVRAILLDEEAFGGVAANPDFGKAREPVLRATAVWRAFGAEQQGTGQDIGRPWQFNQAPLHAPSVFNFFRPDFATPQLAERGLVAPEMQITTHTYVTRVANVLSWIILGLNSMNGDPEYAGPVLQVDALIAAASRPQELIDLVDTRLLGGTLSSETREVLTDFARSTNSAYERAVGVLHLTVLSPDFNVQK